LSQSIIKLNDSILYDQSWRGVTDTTKAASDMADPRKALELLDPVQRALGGTILSSGLIEAPAKLQAAMAQNPTDIFDSVTPLRWAKPQTNTELTPILFTSDGVRYVGWLRRGLLPFVLNCELHEFGRAQHDPGQNDVLWPNDPQVNLGARIRASRHKLTDGSPVAPIMELPMPIAGSGFMAAAMKANELSAKKVLDMTSVTTASATSAVGRIDLARSTGPDLVAVVIMCPIAFVAWGLGSIAWWFTWTIVATCFALVYLICCSSAVLSLGEDTFSQDVNSFLAFALFISLIVAFSVNVSIYWFGVIPIVFAVVAFLI
jgi:hypothetical protein